MVTEGGRGPWRLAKVSALIKQLMNLLHTKKGQERTLHFSLWMR